MSKPEDAGPVEFEPVAHLRIEGSNPLAPTIFQNEPFGEHVEGLSHFRDKSCAVEPAVQTDDFEDSTLCIVISGATLILTDLSKMIYLQYGTPERIRPRPSLDEG